MELPANRRVDAVAADREPGFDLGQRGAQGIAEAHPNAIATAGFVDADAGVSGRHGVGAEPLLHRGQQHALQVAAMDRKLRCFVAGPAPGRLGVDELAEAVEEGGLAGRHGEALERLEDAQRAQLGARMRQDIDADAERQDLGGRLVDAAGDAGAVQEQGQRQAADAGADDDDPAAVHRSTWP